jgi:hypothetical protein
MKFEVTHTNPKKFTITRDTTNDGVNSLITESGDDLTTETNIILIPE